MLTIIILFTINSLDNNNNNNYYYYYYYYYHYYCHYYYDYSQVSIQGIKTKGHNIIGVYVFLSRITRFVRKKG